MAQVSPATAFHPYRTLPSGRVVKLRRINPEVAAQLFPESVTELVKKAETLEERKAVLDRLRDNVDLQLRVIAYLLVDGVEEPRFVDKPPDECSEDEAPVEGLGSDLPYLLKEIIQYNGLDALAKMFSEMG